MVYIVMNNGCYGFIKGQDFVIVDLGFKIKFGVLNFFEVIDLVGMVLEFKVIFVVCSFLGDKIQLIFFIKVVMFYLGFVFIDVILFCVIFNNNKEFMKFYDFVCDYIEVILVLDFVFEQEEILVSYEEGNVVNV